jgi:hypothetical protein
MLKSVRIFLLLGLSSIILLSCWPSPKSGPTAQGKPIPVFVFVDPGIEKSFTDYQVKNRKQTSAWMEKDMEKMLKKAGYAPYLIGKRSEYKAAPGSYLLAVKITNYNPGAKAARMYIGYGVGAASMKVHYELHKGQQQILAADTGAGTGGAWQKAIRKIDVTMIDAVSAKISQ